MTAPKPFTIPSILGWMLLFMLLSGLLQMAVMLGYGFGMPLLDPLFDSEEFFLSLQANGFLLSLMLLISSLVSTALIYWIGHIRRWDMRWLFSFRFPGWSPLLAWFAIVLVYLVAVEQLTLLLGQDNIPPFMVDNYKTAEHPLLFWLAIVLAAPVFEEIYVRGLVLGGMRQTRLGATGAVLLSALFWAILHSQYELYEMLIIVGLGILLGIARLRTGSLFVPVAIHVFTNAAATLQVSILVNSGQL